MFGVDTSETRTLASMEIIKKAVLGNDILSVLKVRSFLFMMASEFFSQFAFNMQNFVFIFIIYAITHSNTAVSGIILSFTVPAVFLSVFTGVFVDRWNKKKVLFLTNLIRGMLLLPFLIPNLHPGFIYTLTFLIAVATQFFIPAESAIIPSLVEKRFIISANAIFAFGIYATMFLGYILSGPILLFLGKTYTILFLIILFFAGTFFVLFITPRKKEKALKTDIEAEIVTAETSFLKEAKEIFSFIRRAKKVLHALMLLTISQGVIFMLAVLAPGYVGTILGVEIENLSWIFIAPAAVGMGIGALLLGSIGKRYEHKWLSSLGFLIAGISLILLPFGSRVTSNHIVSAINSYLPHVFSITILHIIVVLAAIIGFAISLIFVPSNATIQIETHEKMRGRIYGFLNALVGAVSFLPVVLAGGLADLFGVAAVITGLGFIMAITSLLFLIFD